MGDEFTSDTWSTYVQGTGNSIVTTGPSSELTAEGIVTGIHRTRDAVVAQVVEGLYCTTAGHLAGIQCTGQPVVTHRTVGDVLAVLELVAGVCSADDIVVAEGIIHGKQATLADVANVIGTGNAVIAQVVIHDRRTATDTITFVEGTWDSIVAISIIFCELTPKLGITGVVGTSYSVITVHIGRCKFTSASSTGSIGRIAFVHGAGYAIVALIVIDIVLTALTGETEVLRAVYVVITVTVLWGVGTACYRVAEVVCTRDSIIALRIRSSI